MWKKLHIPFHSNASLNKITNDWFVDCTYMWNEKEKTAICVSLLKTASCCYIIKQLPLNSVLYDEMKNDCIRYQKSSNRTAKNMHSSSSAAQHIYPAFNSIQSCKIFIIYAIFVNQRILASRGTPPQLQRRSISSPAATPLPWIKLFMLIEEICMLNEKKITLKCRNIQFSQFILLTSLSNSISYTHRDKANRERICLLI
jgi:hypothetical protein